MRVIVLRLVLLFVVVAALASSGCLRKTEFQCSADTACGGTGVCESTGFCSFADGECSTGRRYDSSAGSLAGQCTGGGTTDASTADTSMPPMDSMADATTGAGCPTGYVALAGAPGHLYKVVATTENWSTSHQACRLTSLSAYLAVPETLAELTAMDAVAGATEYWVGITDTGTEGTWLSVLGAAQTFLPWQPPAPDNDAGGQGEDCVVALPTLHTINDIRCNESRPSICECNP